MNKFICPHCGKQLENQRIYFMCENENEFWCDRCRKIYILEEDGSYIEEEDI